MKIGFFLLPSLLAGCATQQGRSDLETFLAGGEKPDWFLSIGGGQIRLSIGHAERHQVSPLEILIFPEVQPRVENQQSVWESQNGTETIVVEASGVPDCDLDQNQGPSRVRVLLGERLLIGCGGQQILVSGP